jgi:hypothetical protein
MVLIYLEEIKNKKMKKKYIPYKICKGRKFKSVKLDKLIKPISCVKNAIICNHNLLEKNKIRFITQLFR